jgi:hypothetical protein
MLSNDITIEEKEAALLKALSHPYISESTSLRDYLEFVAEEVIKGRAEHLGEYEIGTRVFHKPPEFDPRLDPIVRAHARRLRRRLADYYRHDGRKEHIRLEVPRGSFLPRFVRQHSRFSIPVPLLLWSALLLGLLGIIWVGHKISQVYGRGPGLSGEPESSYTILLLPLKSSPKTTLIVLSADYFLRDSDANLLRIRPDAVNGIAHRPIGNPGELLVTPALRRTAPLVVDGGYTGSGEAVCGALVAEYLGRRGKPVEMRLAEPGKTLDFGASNVIFVGTPPSSLLPRKSASMLDFRLAEQPQPDGTTLPVFQNANVGRGEKAQYPAVRDSVSKTLEVVHSVLSVMPGNDPGATYVVIASQSSAGMRSACEYLVNGNADGDLPAVWRSSELPPTVIEVLLRTSVHDLDPSRAAYVTHHYRDR